MQLCCIDDYEALLRCHNEFSSWLIFLKLFSGTTVARIDYMNLSSARQITVAKPVEVSGIGLHTGVPVTLRLLPAPPDTGYVFRRTDLGGFEIPATVESVAHCSYATTLMRTGVMLSTVEHVLAALRGCGIDNAYVDVDNLEVPIMDGSSEAFAEMIDHAGIAEQPLARRALLVRKTISAASGNRSITIEPADVYEVDCTIDFSHPFIGVQHRTVTLENGSFGRDIASARTFGFIEEVEALRRANLIRGGSLDNAIVLTKHGMLNETGLRFADEFVRHKILDIIGDLALLGMTILGRVRAERSGHLLHAALTSSLLRNRSAWEIVDVPAKIEAEAVA
ncbi:MAG TPA: UDP-3-O-acyl-N-acetylglucosamine deacetylase [Pyrinomonadaceae bacterium]|nr:UDP-3-O-acyl-N-acetylglucosamine deacetylase [Pyrinomonadaceae bacterium]